MNTAFLLMAQFDGRAVVPIEEVRKAYFPHLQPDPFRGKLARGEIKLPVVRMDTSQKAALGIHITDLAAHIDRAREAAARELKQMAG